MCVSAEALSGRPNALALRSAATALVTSLLLFPAGPGAAATFTTFDVTGASATYPFGINAGGSVAGFYRDSSGTYHGFVRSADGTITTFDPYGSIGTAPESINRKGAVTGFYYDESADTYGFV